MSEEIKKDIANTLQFLSEGHLNYANYWYIYNFATENLRGYFNSLEFNNQKVITVAGSIDHALCSCLYGAKDITLFDLNKLTSYYLELKKQLIISLSREDFLNFLIRKSPGYLNTDIYTKIRDNLNSKDYWDFIFNNDTNKEIFYQCPSVNYKHITEYIPYIEKDNYVRLKKLLESFNPKFIHCNVVDLTNRTKELYDLILLSNLNQQSIYDQYKKHLPSKNYLGFMELLSSNLLSNNGTMICGYIYGYDKITSLINPAYRACLKSDDMELQTFPSCFEGLKNDGVVVLKKTLS